MSDAGDKRHQNVYVRLPDGMAALGSAPPLPVAKSTALATVKRMEPVCEGLGRFGGGSGAF